MKKTVLVMVLVCTMVPASFGAIVFNDDFSGDLSQWNLTGNSGGMPYINADKQLDLNPTVPAEPWESSATSVATWNTPGKYELQFDLYHRHGDWQHAWIQVTMPGGLQIGYMDWGNNSKVFFQGAQVGTIAGEFNTWTTYKMVLDGKNAAIYRNGILGWSDTLTSDPNFTDYNTISLWCKYSVISCLFDNVSLNYTPEPATMALLGLGGLLLRRRK